ncbi:hypothetical protein AB4Z21_19355, partial [Paenibacillus sp. MCAF20]
ALTAPHFATSAATASRLMMRDASGRAKVAAPAATDDIARLDTVTAAVAAKITNRIYPPSSTPPTSPPPAVGDMWIDEGV